MCPTQSQLHFVRIYGTFCYSMGQGYKSLKLKVLALIPRQFCRNCLLEVDACFTESQTHFVRISGTFCYSIGQGYKSLKLKALATIPRLFMCHI